MARPPFHPTIGSVPYLNALPLVEGLRASVRCVAPGRMPPLLKKGTLDAALMPTGALLKNEFDIIDTLGIASDGPARTVLLHQKNPDHPPASLALDRHSRTSALLARFLIEERFGARPRLISYDPRKTPPAVILKKVDAALTIGDVSFRPPPAGCRDLGREWKVLTGLPFVFAFWALPPGHPRRTILRRRLHRACRLGRERIEDIARREAPACGLSPTDAWRYLSRTIIHRIGPRERQGWRTFRELCRKRGWA